MRLDKIDEAGRRARRGIILPSFFFIKKSCNNIFYINPDKNKVYCRIFVLNIRNMEVIVLVRSAILLKKKRKNKKIKNSAFAVLL